VGCAVVGILPGALAVDVSDIGEVVEDLLGRRLVHFAEVPPDPVRQRGVPPQQVEGEAAVR